MLKGPVDRVCLERQALSHVHGQRGHLPAFRDALLRLWAQEPEGICR
jgi:hypothetical protein